MSEPTVPQPGARAQAKARPSSWMGAVGARLLGRWSARVGLAWIALLLLCAVFAPFLASSYPLWWRTREGLSFPLLSHLQPVDAVLLAAFFAAVALGLARRAPAGARLGAWAWCVAAAIPLCGWRAWLAAAEKVSGPGWTESLRGPVFFYGASIAVALVLAAVLAGLPWLVRASGRFRWIVLACVVALGVPLAALAPHPPERQDPDFRAQARQDDSISAVFAPVPYSPEDRQSELSQSPPSRGHWLGTDDNGADVLSLMVYACRVAMAVGFISTGISMAIGVVIGGVMGYYARWVDMVGMRLVDVFAAIPTLSILIMICAFYSEIRNIYLIMVILGLFGWVGYAIFIRAEFLRLRNADFVQAAQAVGASTWRILLRHMLPNGISPVLTMASFGVAGAILTESVLSFLGLGLPPGDPSWGQLLEMAQKGSGLAWWLVVFPGLAIFFTVFAYNLVGEALRDALDPKLNK